MKYEIIADTCTSPFFTMRIDSLLVLLYVTCIAISIKRKNKNQLSLNIGANIAIIP